MGGGLRTDLYELNMAASYLRRGMTGPATFSLSIRELPPTRGFLVAAGLEPALDFLQGYTFDDDELGYLRDELGFEAEAVASLSAMRFDGEVRAVPEGTIVFAGEPILEVDAPLPVAQLVETMLLNIVTTHTLLASKAIRYRIAAPDKDLVDFAFRRAHGADAAHAAARSSAIAGFAATSNVTAARAFGLRPAGTMAHSYVEAFGSEAEAFRAFAEDREGPITFLVDTYDTIEGVRTAIRTIRELGVDGALAVRLDSGDLDRLSRAARVELDAASLSDVHIFASGGLDELHVARLVRDGTPIDAFGIGTQMGVSADAPSLDSVYKLVAYDGRAVMKLSEGKVTLPGAKQVFRGPDGDALGLLDEKPPDGTRALLAPVMRAGERVGTNPSISAIARHVKEGVAGLDPALRNLERPGSARISVSPALSELVDRTRAALRGN